MSTMKFSENSKKVDIVTFTGLMKPAQLRLDSSHIAYVEGGTLREPQPAVHLRSK